MAPRAPHPADPALASLGLGLSGALLLGPDLLSQGGLAAVALATGVAVTVGVQAAIAEWRSEPAAAPWRRAGEAGLLQACALLVVAAAAAPVVRDAGWIGVVGALVLWALAGAASRWHIPGGVVGIVAVVGAVVLGASELATGPGFTLLRPRWDGAATWGPRALVAGLLMATAGLGQWTVGPPRRPGQSRAPWAAAGAGVLFATGAAIHLAAVFEVHHGLQWGGPAATALTVLALVAASCALLARRGGSPALRAGVGWLATLWFAGPAFGALSFWWDGVLPLALGAGLLAIAARTGAYITAAAPAAAAGLCLLAAIVGWPGMPERALDGAAMALSLVVVFWVVATGAARRVEVAR